MQEVMRLWALRLDGYLVALESSPREMHGLLRNTLGAQIEYEISWGLMRRRRELVTSHQEARMYLVNELRERVMKRIINYEATTTWQIEWSNRNNTPRAIMPQIDFYYCAARVMTPGEPSQLHFGWDFLPNGVQCDAMQVDIRHRMLAATNAAIRSTVDA